MLFFSAFIVALVVTMTLIPPLMKFAIRFSVVDMPSERKVHTGAIPRIGGAAMMIGAITPVILWLPLGEMLTGLLLALVVLFVFGALDDSSDLDYRLKFLGQFGAVLIVVFVSDIKIGIFPFFGLDPVSEYLSIPITVLFLVGTTNAVNLSDGLDGLAAGVSLLSLCAISLLAYFSEGYDLVLMSFAIIGAIFGFLRFNTFPARIFMGDTGSQFLGFVVGVFAVMLTQKTNPTLNPLLPLFLIGLPIIDTLFVMASRYRTGASLFSADKKHIHHRLLELGIAQYEAVAIIYLSQIGFIVLAVWLRYETDLVVFSSYAAFSFLLLALLLLAKRGSLRREGSGLVKYLSRLDKSPKVHRLSIYLIQLGVVLYLVVGCALTSVVPVDLQISALVLLTMFLVRLVWSNKLHFIPLQVLAFPTIAFAVYQIHTQPGLFELVSQDFRMVLLTILLMLMFFAVRHAKVESFQTTPTDVLVVAVAVGMGILYQQKMIHFDLIPVMVAIVVFFYAAELVMRQMSNRWNLFTTGMLTVLGLLSIGPMW